MGQDYLVSDGQNKYSVPFDLIGEKVVLGLTRQTVEVFYRGTRVAMHRRASAAQRDPIVKMEHIPPEHRRYMSYNMEDFTQWGSSVGEHTAAVVRYFLTSGKAPEQGYKSCASLTKLAERYGAKRLESACGRLLAFTPQTAVIQAGQTVKLEFRNQPLGNLVIEKWGRNGTSTVPLEGVKFEIKYANGQYVDAAGGTLSSNGIYYTDSTGKITLSGITGTVVVTELESVPGYTIDPDSQSQTVTINPNDTQTLRFFNNAVGGVELTKVNEADKTETIPNVKRCVLRGRSRG